MSVLAGKNACPTAFDGGIITVNDKDEYQRTALFADLLIASVSRHGGQGCPPVLKGGETPPLRMLR